jgi:hypothetical protein
MVNVHMKLPKVVQSMLQDKNVLYIVAFLAIVNFFGYIVLRDSYALLIFLSVGFISTYFSKNMTIVLITTLILTNFITVVSKGIVSGKEGFDAVAEATTPPADTTGAEPGADAATSTAPVKPAAAPAPVKAATSTASVKPAAAPAPSGITGAGLGSKALKKVTNSASSTKDPLNTSIKNQDPSLKVEAMTELSPASINDDDDLPVNNRVDYAKTLEKAYDNLENIVGQDGVRGLTSQTNTLMEQQKQLMENMKSMEPLLKTAQSFLDKFESSSMGKLFEKIPGISSMFGGGGGSPPAAAPNK